MRKRTLLATMLAVAAAATPAISPSVGSAAAPTSSGTNALYPTGDAVPGTIALADTSAGGFLIGRTRILVPTAEGLIGFSFAERSHRVRFAGATGTRLSSYLGADRSRWIRGSRGYALLRLARDRATETRVQPTAQGLSMTIRSSRSLPPTAVELSPIGGSFAIESGALVVRRGDAALRIPPPAGIDGVSWSATSQVASLRLPRTGGIRALSLAIPGIGARPDASFTDLAADEGSAVAAGDATATEGSWLRAFLPPDRTVSIVVRFAADLTPRSVIYVGASDQDTRTNAVDLEDGAVVVGGASRARGFPQLGPQLGRTSGGAFLYSLTPTDLLRWGDRFGPGCDDEVTTLTLTGGTAAATGHTTCGNLWPTVRPFERSTTSVMSYATARASDGAVLVSSPVAGDGGPAEARAVGGRLITVASTGSPWEVRRGAEVRGVADPKPQGIVPVSDGDIVIQEVSLADGTHLATTFFGGKGAQSLRRAAVGADGSLAVGIGDPLTSAALPATVHRLAPASAVSSWTWTPPDGMTLQSLSIAPDSSVEVTWFGGVLSLVPDVGQPAMARIDADGSAGAARRFSGGLTRPIDARIDDTVVFDAGPSAAQLRSIPR